MSKEKKPKKPLFKRWWFWLIVVIIGVGVLGGGDDEEDKGPSKVGEISAEESKSEEESKDKEEEIENEEFKIGDEVELDGQIVQVVDVEKSDGEDFNTPKDGKEFIIVTIRIENHGDEKISYNPLNFKMQNSDGQIETEVFTTIDKDTSLSSGDLAPDGNIEGTLVFEQPKDDDGLKLIFEPSFWNTNQIVFDLQ